MRIPLTALEGISMSVELVLLPALIVSGKVISSVCLRQIDFMPSPFGSCKLNRFAVEFVKSPLV